MPASGGPDDVIIVTPARHNFVVQTFVPSPVVPGLTLENELVALGITDSAREQIKLLIERSGWVYQPANGDDPSRLAVTFFTLPDVQQNGALAMHIQNNALLAIRSTLLGRHIYHLIVSYRRALRALSKESSHPKLPREEVFVELRALDLPVELQQVIEAILAKHGTVHDGVVQARLVREYPAAIQRQLREAAKLPPEEIQKLRKSLLFSQVGSLLFGLRANGHSPKVSNESVSMPKPNIIVMYSEPIERARLSTNNGEMSSSEDRHNGTQESAHLHSSMGDAETNGDYGGVEEMSDGLSASETIVRLFFARNKNSWPIDEAQEIMEHAHISFDRVKGTHWQVRAESPRQISGKNRTHYEIPSVAFEDGHLYKKNLRSIVLELGDLDAFVTWINSADCKHRKPTTRKQALQA